MNYADQLRNPGQKSTGLIVVVVMHIVLGWALVSGLARKVVEVIKAPIETKLIEEVKPPPPPPENLPPPPKFAAPPPSFVPPPEIQVQAPPTAPTITTTSVAPPPAPVFIAPPPAPAAPPPAPRAAARPAIANAAQCAPTADDYPAAARRAEATGTTKIRFQVGADGKLAGVQILQSAGPSREHKMLDRVAQSKLSECRFTPGIDANGRPEGASFDVDYVWKLD